MRTTLALDDDILAAAKGLAAAQQRSVGEVVSDLAREALAGRTKPSRASRNGVPLIARSSPGPSVTPELINRLRDEAT